MEEWHLVSELRQHIRKIREDIEKRAIIIDNEIEEKLLEMLSVGREAIDGGKRPMEAPEFKKVAMDLHRLVKERMGVRKGPRYPQISFLSFPALRSKVEELNLILRKRKKIPSGVWKLVDLANKSARSEHEFKYFLKEIEWLLGFS